MRAKHQIEVRRKPESVYMDDAHDAGHVLQGAQKAEHRAPRVHQQECVQGVDDNICGARTGGLFGRGQDRKNDKEREREDICNLPRGWPATEGPASVPDTGRLCFSSPEGRCTHR